MADNTVAGFGKDPLATSHGDSLADQSFQSLKSKEVRDSLSPTEMKFQSMALNNPNNTGWNVQSSKEVSPDGRGFRAETIATTDGVENINGGIAEFKGRNEKHSSAHHQGDDKNFVKKAMESSNSHLQEKVVIGDENSGRTEVRTSSSTSTSSSQVVQSSTNVEYDDGFTIPQVQPQKYLMDSNRQYQQDLQQRQVQEEQRLRDEQRLYEQQFQQQRQHHLNQQERRTTEQSTTTTRQNTEQKNISQNVQTQETHEQNKRYVDIDKASPEYQQHVQYLMQQPGEIISNTVEYPKPNVKMITTVKRLPDGTIVRNKRYETEEVTPVSAPTNRTAPNPTQVRRDSQQQPRQNYQPKSPSHPSQKPSEDMVDSGSTTRYVQDSLTDDVETKFSSVKKSSSKFSSETTSETIQEYDHPQSYGEPSARPKPVTNDFSTHGFPSVRPNKPTQEYPTERPRHAQGYPSQAVPKTNEAVVPHYTDAVENISERRIPTKDGEVVIVSSEKKSNFKTQTNSERIIETEHDIRDDQHDFTTHGFPPVRELVEQPKMYPSERQTEPQEQDFPLDKMPPGSRIIKPIHTPYKQGDDETLVVSSQKSHTTKYNTNTERVIEHEIIRDDQSYPRTPSNTDNLSYTVNTPGDQVPYGEFPGSQRKPAQADFSTQGFPSVRSPNKTTPGDYNPQGDYYAAPKKPTGSDFSTQGFPSVRTPSKPAAGLPSQNVSTHGFPSVRSPTKTSPTQGYPVNGTNEPLRATPSSKTQPRASSPNKYKTPTSTTKETTERVIRKEKEVDSAHRAFAASLRSSSPIDHVRRDSYTTDSHSRQTPRSSVSSTRTFRRDMREGSHDSAPSETSRVSTTTVTRNTPPRNVGGRSVVTRVVTTKTGHGSNDSLSVTSPRSTKSPSPGKIVTTTTTTTRTLTKTPTPTRDVPKSTEKSPVKKPSSSHQPQQAPRSRSSTPSYNNKNQITTTTTTVMADNDDDRSPLSPSFSSRKPQTVVTDKIPQDDWQTRKTVTDDERRTVIGDTTFEKSDKPLGPSEPSEMPRKPQYQQPNVEWVIVDNVDIEEHDADDDDFTTEVVDSKIENVKKTTRNLIINEKQTPTVPIKGQKAPITTEKNLKPQTKLNDKMPQQVRPQKSLPDSRSPPHVPSKSQPKTRDNNQLPKTSPKTPLAFNAPHLKKPATKVPSDASATVRTTLKTSAQIVKDTTTKLIEENKISGRLTKQPQSPLRKPKTEDIKKRSSNEKPIHRKGYPENVNEKVSTTIIETTKNLKRNSKSPVRQPETLQEIPRDMNEEPVYNEPNKPTQDVPASKTPNDEVPNYRSSSFPQNQLPVTESIEIPDDTQNPSTPKFKKPEPIPDYRKPQVGKLHDEPFATDVDELVTDDETHVTTANRTVARHIERFETNCLKDSSSTPYKGPKYPPKPLQKTLIQKKPEKPIGKRPQSPNKSLSPTRVLRRPEDVGETCEEEYSYKIKPSDNIQTVVETNHTTVSLTYPDKKSSKDFKPFVRNQEKPEEPSGRRPQPSNKNVSPTRSPKKLVENETLKSMVKTKPVISEIYPDKTKPQVYKSVDIDDDETVSSKFITNSTKKLIITEQEVEKIENSQYPDKKTLIDAKSGPKHSQESSFEPRQSTGKYCGPTHSPKEVKSPVRDQQRSNEKIIAKPFEKRPQSPSKPLSPTRSPKTTKDENTILETNEFVMKITNKQKAQKDMKTPRDSQSPVRYEQKPSQKYPEKPSGNRPQSPNKHVSPTRSPKQSVNIKTYKTFDNEEYPDEFKPRGRKPLDSDDEEAIVEASKLVINSTKKLIKNEQEFKQIEHLLTPEEKTPKEKPNQKYTEQPKTNLPKQFDTEVSPDRHLIPRKQKESKPLSNDQTEISSQTNDKHAEQKSTSVKPTNNDEDQTYIETNQIYINSKQKQVITDKDCLEHEKSKNKTAPNELTIDKRQKPTTQIQIVTKTKILQSNEPQYKESQKPVSEGSPSKEPESSKHVYNEPKSPKQVLPTRIRPTPKDEETFKTSLRPQKMITENTYKNITDVQTEKKTSNLYKPTDTDQNKHLTEKEDFPTNDLQISTKELKKASKKPQSPSIKVSPTQIEKVPETSVTETVTIKTCQKFSDEDYQEEQISSNKSNKPRDISSSSKQKEPERSHSPNKPTSPIRSKNKPDSKHSIDDSTFTSTLKNTTIIRDNSPSKTLKKPERSSSPGKSSSPTRAQKKPGEEKHPIDNKTFTNTLKNIRDNSPSKTLKKPERSPSPTRKQKKFGEDENYTTTKIVQEEVNQYVDDKNYPGKLTPTKPFEKLQTKPQEPIDTDEEETHKETRHFMTTSKTPKDFPIIPKHKPEQILLEDDNTSRKTLKRTDVVKEKVFATSDNKDLPEKEQPKKRSKSPPEDNLFTSDGDDNVRKPYYRSSPKPEPKYIKPGGEEKPRDNITFTGSTDFSRNASQQLITNERENTESDRKTPKRTENRSPSPCKERSPTHNASSTKPKEQRDKSDYLPSPESKTPKITTVEDQSFVKTLRSSTITEDLNVKNQKPSKDINDEETDAETEELFVETCQKSYVKTENISSTSIEKKPQDKKPETITGLTFPEDTEKLPETCANPEKPWNVPLVELNETERKETPDGAFISKTTDHSSPTSPTYRKKGTGRRDTFEERCRQILGMDTYGDTPGNYKQKPIPEIEETNRTETTKHETIEKDDLENKAIFQVKIEDCDEEDEPLYINNVKKTMHKQINTKEKTRTEPLKQKLEEPKKYTSQEPELEGMNEFMQTSTVPNKSPGSLTAKVPIGQTKKETPQELKFVDNDDNEFGHTVIRTTTVHKESDATKSLKQNPDKPTKNASQKSELEKEELNEFMQTSTAPDKSLKAQPPQQTEVEDNDIEFINKITKTTTKQTKSNETSSRKPEEHPKNKTPDASDLDDEDNEFMRTVTETITVHKKSTKHQPSADIDEQSQQSTEPETCISSKHIDKTLEKEYGIENKEVKITKMISPSSSPRSSSPTKKSTSPRTTSPTKQTIPTEEASKRKPSKDNMEPKISRKPSTQSETETTTIKDRLRSSTRKTKSPPKRDQVDGSDSSSPEHSPNRITERRRSSNISVNTEIIIEHTEMDTSSKKEKSPESKRPQDSVYREIIDSTVLPEKLIRRMPVTERKESAPVHRVTTKEKDSKMSRSTSENLIKVKKPEPRNNSPKASPRPVEHRSRPNKCFATKTINLSTSDRLVSSETMENVVIDIQQAKSSREPSPDKIVPTPVPAYLDTGKPRYPDVIQEPEDERPKRKPQVKNIPIFEEEQNAYVGCHITEIKVEKTESSYDSMDYNPLVEAPPSLDYNSLDTTNDDEESVLTVIEKVTKFQNIAEEMTKPKASEPFQRQYDDKAEIPQDDDCLLSVDEKRERFSKTMENVSKTNEVSQVTNKGTDEDELEDEDHKEFVRNERIYTAKLQPMAPQKSPELVRSISRHISRQNELDELNEQPQQQQQSHINEANKDYPLTITNEDFVECFENQKKKHTKEFKVSHQQQQHHQSKKFTAEKKYQQQPKQNDNNDDDDNNIPNTDDEELIPLTARHTTIIEERRQKDILSRPSVFEGRNKKPTAATPLKCNKSPVKDTEKLRPDIKSRIQPTDSTTITSSSIKPRQTTQRTNKNTDNDYDELCGNNNKNNNNKTLETVVKSIIGKQTKLSSSSGNSSSDKTNDLKKQSTNKKSEKQNTTSVRLRPAQKTDDENVSADGIIISTTEQQVTVRNEKYLNKEKCEKTPVPKTITSQHSSTSSSPLQPLKFQTKEHNLEKLTDEVICLETNTNEIQLDEKTSDIDETVLEPSNKPLKHPHNKSPKMSTKTTTSSTTDSVAARRSLFENNNGGSGAATPTKRTPLASPMSGRRPSYMEHTKSSLEHTRRDSLEVNKNHYSRKSSQPEEEVITTERNTAVKFDVPSHNKRPSVQRPPSTNEDINVEEIFDLEVLEKLLETIQSYEIRRRVRAQIRLIRKNQKNELISNTVVTTKTSITKSGKPLTEEEEPDTTTKQPKTLKDNAPKQTSTKKEYIFEEAYHPPSRKSPTGKRYPYEKPEPEQHSPERVGEKVSVTSTTKKQYYYKDDYQQEEVKEISHETSHSRDSPTRKSPSTHSSPDRQTSPISKSPIRNQERSRSPQSKLYRVTSGSHSPDAKTSPSRRKSSTTTSSNTATNTTTTASATITGNKPLTKRVTTTTTTTTTTATNGDKTPVWADRKNILKAPGTTTPKKSSNTTTSSVDSRTGYTKSIKSLTTSQKLVTNKSSYVDDDCITSSYGIGPTDENGLPLFGIRALKKKKPQVEPSETTEEVTGYVVEEKYYADNKTKPIVERKEFIYSTNPEELQKLKEQVEVTSSAIKSIKDVNVKETHQAALISKSMVKGATPALRSSPEDDFLDTTTKYVRRGSVKEMSEKFIQKEAASTTLTEKSNNYPKAGLILRTNSRKNSRDNDQEGDNYETYKTTSRVQQHRSTVLDDSDGDEHEYEVEEVASRHSGRFITESESECDSIKTQREFKTVTRSFLNSQGEEKIITNVSDCLERMRNADNVVEEGDTAEDQEARALLNKFLGASIIMKGVESSLPASTSSSTNRQSKVITTKTTTNSRNLSGDNDDDNTAKHEIKNTRITKTIKSGSSSSPVTYTTCDIEEIWDEEILKELLEQAKSYEERRKIRSRLRELMADREDQKQNLSSSTTEKTETKEKDGAVVTTTTKVTTRTVTGTAAKPVSPFNKFKQLDSQQSAKSPTTPTTPGGGNSTASPTSTGGNQPIFKFTDPALNARAATVKDQLLQWCQTKTQEYENVQITNFSTSWNNGLAFCALIHHFLPDAFDYSQLTPKNRRKNFELAFTVADEKAGIAPLLDVEDMVVMQRPDWKCVFVYVQSIYRRFRNCQ